MPGVPAQAAEVLPGNAIAPKLLSRTYLSDWCRNGSYDSSWYTVLRLLGKRLQYTVDLQGAGCGCSAALSLVPMYQREELSACDDHYCDAAGTCGDKCSQIDIQDANQHAWHTMMNSMLDDESAVEGLGAEARGLYGVNGSCVNTSRPFQVGASFPVDSAGVLTLMEVVLTQGECSMPLRVNASTMSTARLSAALDAGMTPVVSYFSSGRWSDEGTCAQRESRECKDLVRFSDFSLQLLGGTVSPALEAQALEDKLHQDEEAAEEEKATRAGQPKLCIDGWMQPVECLETFMYKGEELHGCSLASFDKPWCSRIPLYVDTSRDWSLCLPCGFNALLAPKSDMAAPEPTGATTAAPRHRAFLPTVDPTVTIDPTVAAQIQQRSEVPSCATLGHAYLPLGLHGSDPTPAINAKRCQRICADHPECVHWTYLKEDHSCHLGDGNAVMTKTDKGSIAGPRTCDTSEDVLAAANQLMVMRRYADDINGSSPPKARRAPLGWLMATACLALFPLAWLLTMALGRALEMSSARSVPGSKLLPVDEPELLEEEPEDAESHEVPWLE